MRTLSELFYYSVETYRKPDHLLRKKDGAWVPMSSDAFGAAVEEFSMGLRTLGIEKGERVAILSENRPEWMIADLATLCLGGVSVPAYATLPPAQIRHILIDSESRVVVVSNETQGRKLDEIRSALPWLRHVIRMDPPAPSGSLSFDEVRARGREALSTDRLAVRRRADEVEPGDLATLIYTSGTTGEPKGVMLSHSNILANIHGAAKAFPLIGRTDMALSFLPLSHAFERTVTYFWLRTGAAIAFAESVEKVPENLQELKPTVMCSVPRLYEKIYARVQENVSAGSAVSRKIFAWAMGVGRETFRCRLEDRKPSVWLRAKRAAADALVFGKITARTGGRMQLFVSGGAPLAKEIAEFLGAVGFTVCEGYGLTETSPVITANRPDKMRPGSVGLPLEGVEVRIAEDGEILTRGAHVMMGYYRKPEATAEIIDPDGWLHTGDIGIVDTDGFLVITDRKKDIIVTSGGKNIAPQPIENRLKADAFVTEVVMIGNRRNYPTALVVPSFVVLEKWAKDTGVVYATRDELVLHPKVIELYMKRISDLTEDLATFERIKKVALLPNEFTLEAGELTPTLKVKRRVVEERYRAVIEKLYEGGGS